MTEWLLFLTLFFAFFVQSLTGFGAALIAMPLLISLVGIQTAVPLFALIAQTGRIGLLHQYRHDWNWRSMWRISVGSLIAIPIGVWGAQQIDEQIVMLLLGIIMAGYALFALSGMVIPIIKNQRWAYAVGLLSGLLQSAYNTGGAPLVIYGSSQRWQAGEFKSNIQSITFINGLLVITSHAASGNIDSPILMRYLFAVPIILIAQKIGFSLDKYINPDLFRKGVLILLVVVGLRLIF
ncbi:MAG: sulfite exporter TauE/SafE family protein [Anaerolineae bacterium]|nr:sulfite exporter TauE/SafE family protein [Anaerolineae bacterium]MDQ7033316.1 sulfite exporter TauE/SafE family protein [Anaerolineae bacterium]